MVLLESIDLSLGNKMPAFSLKDPFGDTFNSDTLMGENGLIIAFTCNHCPYAIAVWPRLLSIAQDYHEKGIETVFINPNIHPNYPEDSAENMIKKIEEWEIKSPYLVDETQKIARRYQAQCTPDIYVLKTDMTLFYHGRIDDNWQHPTAVTQQDLREALNCFLDNSPLSFKPLPTMGCSIKWQ